jgi:predicted Rossmann fold flavoprotein
MAQEIDLAILGGGAAGFFSAISAAEKFPNKKIILFEKSQHLLSKVRISGGGRCNVTHNCLDNNLLVKNYPRGSKELLSAFYQFSVKDTIEWFKKNGVEIIPEHDGRMFPASNKSQTIVDALLKKTQELNIKIITQAKIEIKKINDFFELNFTNAESVYRTKKLVIACGGYPQKDAYKWLSFSGHKIIEPSPSLFTFNIKDKNLSNLMGISVKNARVKILNSKFEFNGPLLITHWGFSGPAVLKLSAFAAIWLKEKNYEYSVEINWMDELNEDKTLDFVLEKNNNGKKKILNLNSVFPERLWRYFLAKAEINVDSILAEISNKQLNKLSQIICCDVYVAHGKTTFKEEFVTAGGIDLKEINFKTMESKLCKGLFFAGEILNLDGITGGFNFQAAWTTGFISGTKSLAE